MSKVQRTTSIQLPSNTVKKSSRNSDESPHDLALTQEGSEYGSNCFTIPLTLSFHEKERVYALVSWKLKFLASQSDEMNINVSAINVLFPRIQNQVVMTQILSFAGNRQEIFFLLLCLSTRTKRYVVKNKVKLAPLFVEG